MKNKRKQHTNWISVILITIFYDLFIQTNPSKDIAYNQQWLIERLTAAGKLRRNKVLNIWYPIKFIIVGLIFAGIIVKVCSSDLITTLLILLDVVIVGMLIWSNRNPK